MGMEINRLEMTYHLIVTPEGEARLIRADGKGITQAEQERLFRAIVASKYFSRNRQLIKSFAPHLKTLAYVFPTSAAEMRASGACVYWVTLTKYPGAVKIGRTKSLVPRMKNLWRFEGEEPRVIAFVKTPYSEEIEATFHALFADDLMYGREWFAIDAVAKFMSDFDERWQPYCEDTE